MMFRYSAILFFLFCTTATVFAQPTIPAKRKLTVVLYSSPTPLEVDISELKNSSIVFTAMQIDQEDAVFNPEVLEIPIPDINYLRTSAKNGPLARAFMGGLVGFGIGGLMGVLMGDDKPCTAPKNTYSGNITQDLANGFGMAICKATRTTGAQKAVIVGTPLGIVGAVVGLAGGTVKIPIHGKKENYYKKLGSIRNLME